MKKIVDFLFRWCEVTLVNRVGPFSIAFSLFDQCPDMACFRFFGFGLRAPWFRFFFMLYASWFEPHRALVRPNVQFQLGPLSVDTVIYFIQKSVKGEPTLCKREERLVWTIYWKRKTIACLRKPKEQPPHE